MPFQPTRIATLLSATAAAAVALQAPVMAQPGTLGPARYDANRKAIVVPYTGDFPAYTSGAVGGPPRVFFDFNAAPGFRGVPTGTVSGHPSLRSWAMAARAGGTRLTLTFAQGARVAVLNDRARKQILLIPEAPGATTPPALPEATPAPAGGTTRTFRQTFGTTDFAYTVGPRPRGAATDQVRVNVGSSGITDFHVTSEPERDYVSFSISIQGRPAGAAPAATPKPVAKPTAKPAAKPTPKPVAKPSAKPQPTPAPRLTPTPMEMPLPEETPPPLELLPTPEPLPTPAPEATPVPLPEATPSPIVEEIPTAPGTVLSLYGDYNMVGLSETAPGVSFDSTDSWSQGGMWEARFGGNWGFQLGLQHTKYLVRDQQVQLATGHDRDEYELNTGFGYRFTPGGTDQLIGIGVLARYMANNNILPDTGAPIGEPASPSILTSPANLFVSPSIFGRLELPLFGPLGLQATGGVAPFMVGLMSPTAEGLSGMLGYWASPMLTLRLGMIELGAGYAYTAYTGNGYDYNRSGPRLRADLRF